MSNWQNFPFSVNGINFNSRVDMNSEMGKRISQLPVSIFVQMNQSAVTDLFGDMSGHTLTQIKDRLEVANAGGTQAFLELA
jgi:hypothetical protein